MRYFRFELEWKTRPLYRKGRLRTERVTFAAEDLAEAYRLALDEAKTRYPRHKWRMLHCEELTPPAPGGAWVVKHFLYSFLSP